MPLCRALSVDLRGKLIGGYVEPCGLVCGLSIERPSTSLGEYGNAAMPCQSTERCKQRPAACSVGIEPGKSAGPGTGASAIGVEGAV